jgi:hypothetical protein
MAFARTASAALYVWGSQLLVSLDHGHSFHELRVDVLAASSPHQRQPHHNRSAGGTMVRFLATSVRGELGLLLADGTCIVTTLATATSPAAAGNRRRPRFLFVSGGGGRPPRPQAFAFSETVDTLDAYYVRCTAPPAGGDGAGDGVRCRMQLHTVAASAQWRRPQPLPSPGGASGAWPDPLLPWGVGTTSTRQAVALGRAISAPSAPRPKHLTWLRVPCVLENWCA